MLARRDARPELARLAGEVLLEGARGRSLARIDVHDPDLRAVEEHRDVHRLRSRRPRARGHDAEEVLPIDGEAVQDVQRVGQAEPALVVVGERRGAGLDLGPHGLQARECRLEGIGAEERGAGHALRRLQVLLQEDGGDGEHVADVVEPVPGVVVRERVARPQVHPEQVAHRVVVLRPVQPARGHPPGIGRPPGLLRLQLGLEPAHHRVRLHGVGPGHGRRRHLAGLELLDDLLPDLGRALQGRGQRMGVEAEARVLQDGVMAAAAVARDERSGGAGIGDGRGGVGTYGAARQGERHDQPGPSGSSPPSHFE